MKQLAALVALALAGLAVPALAAGEGAETITIEQTLPFDTVVDNPCSGEAVVVTGEAHFLTHETIDATGGDHAVSVVNLVGVTGTSATGTRYVFQQITAVPFNNPEGRGAAPRQPGLEFSQVQTTTIIATGPTDNLVVELVFHVTLNANGELTAVVEHVHARCVG